MFYYKHKELMRVTEYIFGSTKYLIWTRMGPFRVPMGLYNRLVPKWVKYALIRRDLRKRLKEG